jgi:hypothetical protein
MNMPDGMVAIQWARVMVCMVVVYITVEIEKWLVDPIMMPIVRPAFKFVGKFIPKWFKDDQGGSHAVDAENEEKMKKEAEKEATKSVGPPDLPKVSAASASGAGDRPTGGRVSHTYGQAFARISHSNQKVQITLAD